MSLLSNILVFTTSTDDIFFIPEFQYNLFSQLGEELEVLGLLF